MSDYNPSPFRSNPYITSVKIDKRIYNIGSRMFVDASNLRSVSLPAGLESIGYGAFVRTGVTEICIPTGVTIIGDDAFYGCANLSDITVMCPSIAEIYESTFEECKSDLVIHGWAGSSAETYANEKQIAFATLDTPDRTFVFPENLVEIGSEAFTKVNAWAVVIPGMVTTIAGNPFTGSDVQILLGYKGSAAEVFATGYGYLFMSLEGSGS